MLQTINRTTLSLTSFVILTTLLTAGVFTLTEPSIQKQSRAFLLQKVEQVLPSHLYDNDILSKCYIVTKENSKHPYRIYLGEKEGSPSVLAVETIAPNGYSGPIKLLIGIDLQGTVLGVRVLNHKETPGLGDKIEIQKSDWITQFTGQIVQNNEDQRWGVKKENGMFDQFTGATITPRAIIHEVKRTALYFKEYKINPTSSCSEPIYE